MNTTDEALRESLREAMDGASGAPPAQPGWHQLERGMRRARRRRITARAGKTAGAGLLAVSATFGLVQSEVVPSPTWATVTVPSSGGESALSRQDTRGSLAGDERWIAGLRSAFAAAPAEEDLDGSTWSPPPARDVDVIFAGDTDGFRLALVEGDWRRGVLGDRRQTWLAGPPGAAPGAMVMMGSRTPADVAFWSNNDATEEATGVPGMGAEELTIVAVAARPTTFTLELPPVYEADGTVSRDSREPSTERDGVLEVTLPYAGKFYDVDWPGRPGDLPVSFEAGFGSWKPATTLDTSLPPLLGGAAPGPDWLRDAERLARHYTDLDEGPARLLWAGEVGGQTATLVALTAPSGARLLVALRQNAPGGTIGTVGMAGAVLPAGPLEQAALAWRLPAGLAGRAPAATVLAVGPEGTVRAEFLDGAGRQLATAASAGGGFRAEAPGATRVRFTGDGGRDLGTVPVRAEIGEPLWWTALGDEPPG